MENAIVKARKDGQQNEDPLQCLSKGMNSAEDDIVSNRLVGKLKPEHVFISDNRIPKQIISFDEQYLRRYLELIQMRALKAASCNIPSDMAHRGVFSDNLSSRKISSGNTCYLNEVVIEFPFVAGTENVVIGSTRDSIIGAVTRSKSMINILKSPLLRQFGASDSSVNFGRTSLVDVEEPIHSNFVNSPRMLHTTSSQKVQKGTMVLKDQLYGSEDVHNRLSSLSSTNSTCSDQSSSSAPANVSRGMLHCTWNNGVPHFVFSVDDQRENFIANLLKIESPDNKVLDYMYTFHSRAGGKKQDEIHENESDFIGRMRVLTSFTLLPDNTKIMETRFVLFGSSDDFVVEMPTSMHTHKKSKGFPKKVADVFKASHNRHRNSSKLKVSNAILENYSLDPCQDSPNNFDPASRAILSDNHLPPNLELAAIIVKDHIRDNNNEANIGGWGLKFLKKVGNRQTNTSVGAEVPCQCCLRNNGDYSTSTDILIPAGFHGGPKTRNGGPSSLIERWRSGGRCDCGGWDIGCPLTVLNTRPSRTEVLSQTDISCEHKTFDLFVEGSKQDVPTMRMVNIRDGLYYIPFQSPLSAMQSFSIAVAIIHTHSMTFNPILLR